MYDKIIKTILLILIFTILLLSETAIPDTFDLRNYNGTNFVTSIKSQQGGTCWTHGTMASIEGNLLMTGTWSAVGDTGEPNLAEYHLDWWNGFNRFYNKDIFPDSGEGLEVHYGGDYRVSTAYLSRGEGAVRDIDGQSFDTAPKRDSASYHYYYPRNVEWYIIDSALTNIDTVKRAIMEHGVLATCYYSNSSFYDGNIFYQPDSDSNDPNHSVAIVGWDDNKETQADSAGAWLIKNSWGTYNGDNGYYWISYYDKHACKHDQMGAVSFQDVELMKYDTIYFHDYHGWRETKSDVNKAFNCFVSENNPAQFEVITAVSFFVAEDKVNYTIKIYDVFDGTSLIDLLIEKSGYVEHTGFHTINLNNSDTLTKNDSFYVLVEFDKGGHPYDCTSEIPVLLDQKPNQFANDYSKFKSNMSNTIVRSKANPGESYYFDGGLIHDLYDFDSTANFCIKVLINYIYICTPPTLPTNYKLFQNYPNPFNSATTIEYSIPKNSQVEISIYDIAGNKITTLLNETKQIGNYKIQFDGSKYASGIYFYQLRTTGYFEVRKMVLVK
ncbi:MAG: lectin like domain-containing protein [Candidatus Marinimicrobia bacterium]|nr:lectin like domain-containing protein [Candidatus Neomarinimicrobiota bacterium]